MCTSDQAMAELARARQALSASLYKGVTGSRVHERVAQLIDDHQTAVTDAYAHRLAEQQREELAGYIAPAPPIGCLTLTTVTEDHTDAQPQAAAQQPSYAVLRAAYDESWQLIAMQKELLGALRRIVMTAVTDREDKNIRSEPCERCGRDHMTELYDAIVTADQRYAETFPVTADGPARPGRLPDAAPPSPTGRVTLQDLTPGQLGALYDERDQLRAWLERGFDEHMAFRLVRPDGTDEDMPCADWCYACRLDRTEAERDGAYNERAHLAALLAALHPSVIAPAPDVDEDGWQILYLRIGGKQASWHIAPRDAGLFAHVEHVPADDRRAQWDGHTTEQKYTHIEQHAARLYAEARGRAESPADEQYRYATTWAEYNAGRAALDEPKE